MLGFKRVMALLAIAGVGLVLAACSREITRIEVVEAAAQACFECHSDSSTFLVAAAQQWENSQHASGHNIDRNYSPCTACHTGEGFIAVAGGGSAPGSVDNPTTIHCFTCHAPHENGDFRLRWNAVATLTNGESFDLGAGNLCVACHQARYNVNTTVKASTEFTSVHWGPHHSVQGDMLIGSNGYEYDDYDYEYTAHRSATQDGCVDCHMETTSNNVVGGHAFNMEYDLGGDEILNTAACAKCHGEIDDFDYHGVQTSIESMVEELGTLLTTAGLLEDGEPIEDLVTSADSAGAVWNYLMAEEDRSHGVHNPAYIRGLLESSIQFMEGTLRPRMGATK